MTGGIPEQRNCGSPCLRGNPARFGPGITLLIDKVEKLPSCSCVAERAMMVF
jgi:hypothetical protein